MKLRNALLTAVYLIPFLAVGCCCMNRHDSDDFPPLDLMLVFDQYRARTLSSSHWMLHAGGIQIRLKRFDRSNEMLDFMRTGYPEAKVIYGEVGKYDFQIDEENYYFLATQCAPGEQLYSTQRADSFIPTTDEIYRKEDVQKLLSISIFEFPESQMQTAILLTYATSPTALEAGARIKCYHDKLIVELQGRQFSFEKGSYEGPLAYALALNGKLMEQ